MRRTARSQKGLHMKHIKWVYAACISGYYVFAIVGTYVVPASYDAWVTATCIFIFIIVSLGFYGEWKTKHNMKNFEK
jgi:uncharacterized membrane protein YoaK (UPF0700 family)